MARPAWQKFTASEIAARMGDVPYSDIAGALITRYLVAAHPDVGVEMSSATSITSYPSFAASVSAGDYPKYAQVMRSLLTNVGAVGLKEADTWTVGKAEREAGALWLLARVAYLWLPSQEIEAARELARQVKTVDRVGVTPGPWEIGTGGWTEKTLMSEQDVDEGWDGLHGFGTLRTDLYAATPAESQTAIMQAFDALVRDTTQRKEFVKSWQRWAAAQDRYPTEEIDGLWGPMSETAFVSLLPRAYGRATTLADLRDLNYGGVGDAALLATGISRDLWIAANPNALPPRPPPAPETTEETQVATAPPGITVTSPKPPATPVATEETIVIEPEAGDAGATIGEEPQRVVITLPSGETETVTVTAVEEGGAPAKRAWLPWVLGGSAAVALVVGAVVASKPKEKGGHGKA